MKRVLQGANQGGPLQRLPLGKSLHEAAALNGFDVQGYRFKARQEQNRKPQVVKVGLIQNSIKAPTTAPYADQTQVPTHALAAVGQAVCLCEVMVSLAGMEVISSCCA